jgi:hypothetical protein
LISIAKAPASCRGFRLCVHVERPGRSCNWTQLKLDESPLQLDESDQSLDELALRLDQSEQSLYESSLQLDQSEQSLNESKQ